MDSSTRNELIASTPLAWVTLNNMVNENQQPIEFKNHRFLIDFYADQCSDIVSRKSAQIGFSVAAILKSFHAAKYLGQNVIYALPTNNVVQDFVKPKVNPLITSNPALSGIVTDDSVSYKRVGGRNLFFKGGFSDREAISITGDILVVDEYDRMPDMGVVNTFDSRLQASANPKRWRFSNPSGVGFGVDALYQDSNQLHWFVKCHHCNHEWYMDWEKGVKVHYVDRERGVYACGKCDQELSDEDRRMGRWVARFQDRPRHGYWFSQMMAPWVSAKRVIEQYEESNVEFFHNFVLGKAYTPSDLIVNRETILRACAPSTIPKLNVVIGVDQNVSEQIWVAGTPQGVFAHGRTKSWEDLEKLKLMWNAIVVCDPAPYPTMPKIMAEKYNDWYLCYLHKEFKDLSVLEWKGSIVYADRTRLLDIVANEITEAKLLFRESPYALEDYIADWQNLYRTTVNELDGRSKSKWLKKDNKESDFSLATCLDKNTKILTARGNKPISEVEVGEQVLTRNGFKSVLASGQTGVKPVIEATFSNGSNLIATADHEVFTSNRGFIPLSELLVSDNIHVCESQTYQKTTPISMDANIPVGLTHYSGNIESISGLPLSQKPHFIPIFGDTSVEKYLQEWWFTTRTKIHSIMIYPTWRLRLAPNTNLIMLKTEQLISPAMRSLNGWRSRFTHLKLRPSQRPGSVVQLVRRVMPIRGNGGTCTKNGNFNASNVAKFTSHRTPAPTEPVLELVTNASILPKRGVSIWQRGLVLSVEKLSKLIAGNRLEPAQNPVHLSKLVYLNESRPVYNISVEECPEYYANGLLVHNCYMRVGLSRVISSGNSTIVEPMGARPDNITDEIMEDGRLKTTITQSVKDTFDSMDW